MAERLHFASGSVPDELYGDIQALNKFQDGQFKELATIILNFLSNSAKVGTLPEGLQVFADLHGVKIAALNNVSKSLVSVANGALRINLKAASVQEDLIKLGLSEEKSVIFSSEYDRAAATLAKSALAKTITVNRLIDMDWKFGVTAASSELNKVGSTFIQLKLTVDKGSAVERVCMELTLPQFYDFLHEMQKAKSSLEYFN